MPATTGGILVIGYGNELRGDDGVGPFVAGTIERKHLPGVRTLVLPQLLPELAPEIADAKGVIFVDAAREGLPHFAVSRLEPAEASPLMTHALDPPALLAIAQVLYGRAPDAWLVTVAANDFEPGAEISRDARSRAIRAILRIHWLIQRLDKELR
jgi:hydrogenase maturation protease